MEQKQYGVAFHGASVSRPSRAEMNAREVDKMAAARRARMVRRPVSANTQLHSHHRPTVPTFSIRNFFINLLQEPDTRGALRGATSTQVRKIIRPR